MGLRRVRRLERDVHAAHGRRRGAFGYLSVSFILLLIRHYGAANTEVVKSMRKMVSIALSMTLYPKPWGLEVRGGRGEHRRRDYTRCTRSSGESTWPRAGRQHGGGQVTSVKPGTRLEPRVMTIF